MEYMVTIDEVLGKSVMGIADQYIGDVNNIDIDAKTWQITLCMSNYQVRQPKCLVLKRHLKALTSGYRHRW